MLKRVLVPLDGSTLAETALPYVKQIIKETGLIILMMAIDQTSRDDPSFNRYMLLSDQQENAWRIHAEDYLAQIATQFASSKLKVETIVVQGSPADGIVDIAKSSSIDAIVMSTHGRTGLSRLLLGNVTQKVLNAAPCPVLVIPNGSND